MRSLSSTVSDIPSSWLPSRNVVSYIWIALAAGAGSLVALAAGRDTPSPDMFHPLLVLGDLAAHGAGVLGGESRWCGGRARDRPVVDRVHGAHLGRRAAHEHLLGHVKGRCG